MAYARLLNFSIKHASLPGLARASTSGRPGARHITGASTLQAADPQQQAYAPVQQQQQQQEYQQQQETAAAPANSYRAYSAVEFYRQADAMTITASNSPTWKAIDSGAWTVEKSGALLFTFAKGLGKAGRPKPGEARFDWQNKQTIALSPVEFCTLVEHAGPMSRQEKVEFFHDPGMGTPSQGKLTKKMYGTKQQNGYAVNLHVGSNNFTSGIILSAGELATLQHLAAFMVPRLYGFDKVFFQ